MGKFFEKKTVIYLDQFAVSNLSENEDWCELLNLFEAGVESDRFIIPYSLEHLLESSHKDFTKAQNVDRLLYKLSKGRILEREHIITANILMCLLRNKKITNAAYIKTIDINSFENQGNYFHLQNQKKMFDDMIAEGTYLANQIREITRAKKQQTDFADLPSQVELTSENYQNELTSRLLSFHQSGTFKTKTINFSKVAIPHWADTLMNYLIYDLKITKSEAKKGYDLINQFGIKRTLPLMFIRTALETILSIKQQKETHNDHIDIIRLCIAISYADIIITDKSKVFDIKTLKLDSSFKTDVYSGSKNELINFKEKIKSLLK